MKRTTRRMCLTAALSLFSFALSAVAGSKKEEFARLKKICSPAVFAKEVGVDVSLVEVDEGRSILTYKAPKPNAKEIEARNAQIHSEEGMARIQAAMRGETFVSKEKIISPHYELQLWRLLDYESEEQAKTAFHSKVESLKNPRENTVTIGGQTHTVKPEAQIYELVEDVGSAAGCSEKSTWLIVVGKQNFFASGKMDDGDPVANFERLKKFFGATLQ